MSKFIRSGELYEVRRITPGRSDLVWADGLFPNANPHGYLFDKKYCRFLSFEDYLEEALKLQDSDESLKIANSPILTK